ncbi:MAG: SDR family NAD(P)-dependent oxidoreductase, partial [Flavobacterium sp.]
AKIFITGSADGLGQLAANSLIKLGHEVVLHARNAERADLATTFLPGAAGVLIADLSDISQVKKLASEANALGKFDAVIHNAGLYHPSGNNPDSLPVLFTVNSLAPYVLTCMMTRPDRLVYISSDMHMQGNPHLDKLVLDGRDITYSDTKLHDLILAKSVARKWNGVISNAIHPGWVPTKMGGTGAPDDLELGYETQVWLAASDDDQAKISGRYLHHKQEQHYLEQADDIDVQEKFLTRCEEITGVRFPKS